MEYDVVFSDEVDQTCFGIFPPFFPRIGKKLLGVADIADRCIEPDIEHFALSTFNGYRNTPVEVTAYGTWLKSHVEPALALSVYVVTPFLVIFENPFAQPGLMLVEGQIPMLGFAHDWL